MSFQMFICIEKSDSKEIKVSTKEWLSDFFSLYHASHEMKHPISIYLVFTCTSLLRFMAT